MKCWEVSTGYCVRTYTGHSDWVRCLSVTPSGELIASAGSDQTIIIWKTNATQPYQVNHNLLHLCGVSVVHKCSI